MLALCLSFYLYNVVIKHHVINFGKYDYKIFLFAIFNSFIPAFIGLSFNEFGHTKYWCLLNSENRTGYGISIFLSVSAILVGLIISFFYLSVILELLRIQRNVQDVLTHTSTRRRSVIDFIDKICHFVFSAGFIENPDGSQDMNNVILDPKYAQNEINIFSPNVDIENSSKRHSVAISLTPSRASKTIYKLLLYMGIFLIQWAPTIFTVHL